MSDWLRELVSGWLTRYVRQWVYAAWLHFTTSHSAPVNDFHFDQHCIPPASITPLPPAALPLTQVMGGGVPRGSTSEDLRVHVCARVQLSVFAWVETELACLQVNRHLETDTQSDVVMRTRISNLTNIIKNAWNTKRGATNLVQGCLPSHRKTSEIWHSRPLSILWKLRLPCVKLPTAKPLKKASHFLTSTPQVASKPPRRRT